MHSTAHLSPSNLHPAAELPYFVQDKVRNFYHERVHKDWGGSHIMRGRKPVAGDLLLQSNDYLAIARHPDLAQAQAQALEAHGQGTVMSSVFVHETHPLHVLEKTLAQALGYGDGVVAQSGYLANVGLIQAIADEHTPVYIDMLAHTSLWEGIRAAGAKAVPSLHNEPDHMRRMVLRHGPGVILIDSVYSTTGARAPIQAYADIAAESGSVLVVDESHSLGTHGPHGEGLVAQLGLTSRVHFITASLAKTYSCRAGLVAAPEGFGEYLSSTSFPAIFSSCLLPQELAAIGAAHRIIQREDWRRARLWQITGRIRTALAAMGYPITMGSEQIIAFEVGIERDTMRVRDILEANGIFGSVFCAPATARNRSLIRLTLNAGMSDADIDKLLSVCRDKYRELAPQSWSASRRLRGRAPGFRAFETAA